MATPSGRMDETSWGQTLYRYRTKAALDATKSAPPPPTHATRTLNAEVARQEEHVARPNMTVYRKRTKAASDATKPPPSLLPSA
ncbi:hypothetical protein T484DRAFT_1869252 [Baffinella frigidus]|nr:hypothetical protein T484DRAFT_1869252 [Cryptophyta sp. CCMP2293]